MHHKLLLNKLPILNAKQELFAYQMVVAPIDQTPMTAPQWEQEALGLWQGIAEHIGFEYLTAGKPVFYQAPLEMLQLHLLPKIEPLSNLYVEVGTQILSNKEALSAVKEMMKAGVKVAMQDYQPDNSAYEKLASIAKFAKIPAEHLDAAKLDAIQQALAAKNIDLIVSHIDTEEAFEHLKAQGAKLFQGYFFTNPIVSTQKEIASNRLAMLKLLAEVNDPKVDFAAVAETIGSDVGLTHKILSAINHPQNDLPYVVESLKDAVNFMGIKRLKFWVNMLMLSEVDDVPKELLVTALVRANFLERVSESIGQQADKERFFMVGLFSTLNAFLKAPMTDIVEELPLSTEVRGALVDQSGLMGKALFVVRSLEQGNMQVIMAGFQGVDVMSISSSYMDANGWARKTLTSLAS